MISVNTNTKKLPTQTAYLSYGMMISQNKTQIRSQHFYPKWNFKSVKFIDCFYNSPSCLSTHQKKGRGPEISNFEMLLPILWCCTNKYTKQNTERTCNWTSHGKEICKRLHLRHYWNLTYSDFKSPLCLKSFAHQDTSIKIPPSISSNRVPTNILS